MIPAGLSQVALELAALGLIAPERLRPYYPRVRDRDDVAVLQDPDTGVIVLSSSAHVSPGYYRDKTGPAAPPGRAVPSPPPRLEDDARRARMFGPLLRNRRWLDFGCGLGGLLDLMRDQARSVAGLEPNLERAAATASRGHRVLHSLEQVPTASLDVISLFHVLEHLTAPSTTLEQLRDRLVPGGLLLVEVPHARDALFSLYDCEPFKRFTFWSEHLVLHTRHSLKILLERAGLVEVEVSAQQRYPLANHLHWLARQAPGGQQAWPCLDSPGLHAEYEAVLARIDRTDTLVAMARAPAAPGPRGGRA